MDFRDHIDIASAKERFMNNEALYKKFLFRFPDDKLMAELEQHLAEKNAEQAFRDIHTLKGMVGNLSLYKLMETSSHVTEILRANNLPEESDMEPLRAEYKAAVEAVRTIMEEDIPLF